MPSLQDFLTKQLEKGIVLKENKDFLSALQLFQDIYGKSKKTLPLVAFHALLNIGTVYKLKDRFADNKEDKKQAEKYFLIALTYGEKQKLPQDELHHALFLLAQAKDAFGKFSESEKIYKTVYDYFAAHSRGEAFLGDIQRHWGMAIVRSGQVEEGTIHILEGLKKIRSYDEKQSFDKRNFVWETGALLSLAYVYRQSDKKLAEKYAKEALGIAEKCALSIRREESIRMLRTL